MKAILFDFGGTLDTNGIHWSEQLWEIYEKNNAPLKKAEFEKGFVLGDRKLESIIDIEDGLRATFEKKIKCEFEVLLEEGYIDEIDNDLMNAIIADCISLSLNNINNSKKLLENLKGKYQLGVVSNYYGNLKAVLKEVGIIDFFDLAIDSSTENIYKPDPALYQLAMDRLGLNAVDTFIVGDSYKNDIQPGRKLNAKTVWLDVKSWTRPESIECADYIISDLSELKEIACNTN